MSNKLVNETIKENGNEIPANQGNPAPEPEGTGNNDNGNDAGNTPESTPVKKKGLFARIGETVDNAVSKVADGGAAVWNFAKKNPIPAAGGAAALLYGGYRLYKTIKGNDDPADDNIVDVEWNELPAAPEVAQIPVQEAAIPQVEIPIVPEVETVQEVVEGPTEGIFDEQ